MFVAILRLLYDRQLYLIVTLILMVYDLLFQPQMLFEEAERGDWQQMIMNSNLMKMHETFNLNISNQV